MTEPTTTDGKKTQMISTRQSTAAQGRHREEETIWSDSDNGLRLESNSNQLKKKHKQHKQYNKEHYLQKHFLPKGALIKMDVTTDYSSSTKLNKATQENRNTGPRLEGSSNQLEAFPTQREKEVNVFVNQVEKIAHRRRI